MRGVQFDTLPHSFVEKATHITNCDVLLADVNHYRVNELQAADKTLQQVIKFYNW